MLRNTEVKNVNAEKTRVAVLAGRRIDALTSGTKRFPLERITNVSRQIDELFVFEGVTALVSSAACGADLIALEVARARNLRTRIILPFDVETFKKTSVTDRPGNWEVSYYDAIGYAQGAGDLIVLGISVEDAAAFSITNQNLINEAALLAGDSKPLAITVWDGASHGNDDATSEFRKLATEGNFDLVNIPTQ